MGGPAEGHSGLAGWIDVAQRDRIAGWAACPSGALPQPVELSLWIAATARCPARHLTTFLANGYRPDHDPLETWCDGRVGFDVDLRDLALPRSSFLLDVREATTGARLPNAPRFIPSAEFRPPALPYLAYSANGRPICRLPADVLACVPERDGAMRIALSPGMVGVMVCAPTRINPGDARPLGVCVSAATLDGTPLDLASDVFRFGFHECEGEPGRGWRWTADAAFIGVGGSAHASIVGLNVSGLKLRSDVPPRAVLAAPHLSIAWRSVEPGCATLPYVGRNFLGPPIVRPLRPPRVMAGSGLRAS